MFKVGDIVRLRNGEKPQRVERINTERSGFQTIECQYLGSVRQNPENLEVHWRKPRDIYDFVLYEGEDATMTQQLWETVAEPKRFGVKIATNSQGKIVLEMKDKLGAVELFDPHEVRVVLPYTMMLSDSTGHNSHVRSKPGIFQVGDVVLDFDSGKMFKVTELDTQNGSARKLRLFKLVGDVFDPDK
jgi:hypothetical protein